MVTTTAGTSPNEEKIPMYDLANENPLGIKIKEITKPEEIRFTDDKPKPYNPFKSSTTTTTTTTTASPNSSTVIETSTEAIKKLSTTESTSTSTVISISTEPPKDSNESSTEDSNQLSGEHESRDYMDDGALSGDELTSGAPPIKAFAEGEVEPQVLLASADSNTIGDNSGNKSVRQTVENNASSEIDQSSENSSELFGSSSESTSESSTPSYVVSSERSGEESNLASSTPKNLVVVRHGGKTESFLLSGVEELQRVEELDVISSTTENSQEIRDTVTQSSSELFGSSSTFDSMEIKSSEEMVMDGSSSTTGTPENFEDNITVSLAINKSLDNTLSDSSIENLTNNSIEVSTQGPDNSSENSSEILSIGEQVFETIYYPEEKSTAFPSNEEPIDTVFYGTTEGPFDGSSTTDDIESSSSSESSSVPTTLGPVLVSESSSTPKRTSTELIYESTSSSSFDDEDSTLPENPEYPPIPDDLSLMHKEEEEEKRRLPSKMQSDETVSSTAGPCDECDSALKTVELSTRGPTLATIKLFHKDDTIDGRAPGEPHLVPEWERTTTTTKKIEESTTLGPKDTVNVLNDIPKTNIVDNVAIVKLNKSEALTQIETLPNDVESEEKYGRKEPTTERPTTRGYANIDAEESASSSPSEYDGSTADNASPKDDAESIKMSSGSVDEETNVQYSLEGSQMPSSFVNYLKNLEKDMGWPF